MRKFSSGLVNKLSTTKNRALKWIQIEKAPKEKTPKLGWEHSSITEHLSTIHKAQVQSPELKKKKERKRNMKGMTQGLK